MNRIQQLMKLHRLFKPAGEGGSDTGGTGGGDDGAAAAAAAAATAAAAAAAAAGAGEGGEGEGGEGGQKKPSDAEAALLKDVMKQKAKTQAAESALAAIQAQLKTFEGIDVAQVRQLLADQQAAETKKLEEKGDYDRLKAQLVETHKTERTALETKLADEARDKAALRKQIGDMTLGTSFTGSEFLKELTLTPAKARVIYGPHFDFVDGKVVAYDKPEGASERTPLVDADGNTLSFDAALKKFVDADPDREYLYRSTLKPGAGSSTSRRQGAAQKQLDATPMTSIQKITAGLKNIPKA